MPCVKGRKAESDAGIMRARSVSIYFLPTPSSAVGYNFRRLIRCLRILLCLILGVLFPPLPSGCKANVPFAMRQLRVAMGGIGHGRGLQLGIAAKQPGLERHRETVPSPVRRNACSGGPQV
jgi:hypothetical protein